MPDSRRTRPRLAELAGLGAVSLFVTLCLLAGLDARTDGRRVRVGAEAAEGFVEQWQASRESTYSATTVFTRTGPDGTTFRLEGRRVQRPPDELVITGVDSESFRDDEVSRCVAGASEGEFRCFEPSAVGPYDTRVAAELDSLRSYFDGDPPIYSVRSTDDGCYQLTQRRPHPLAPYGRRASFCFDAPSDVLTRVEITYDSGVVETTVLTEIDQVVTDSDLELEPPG